MAIKLIDATKEEACRTAEADAIRAKTGGSAAIDYDWTNSKGFSAAIAAISPTLEAKTKSYTPSETAQSEDVEPASGYDGLSKVTVNVGAVSSSYVGSGITRRDSTDLSASGATVTAPAGYYASSASLAVGSGTAGTPSASKGSVSNHAVTVTPSVTNSAGYITGGTISGTGVSVSASELVSGTYTFSASGTQNVTNYQYASVSAGTAGTPTATKGSVSNHSISVTPSVTNTGGYIASGTKTGTAVTVSASELVSGNLPITENGTDIDVTNYETVSVDVSGGGEPITVEVSTFSISGDASTAAFGLGTHTNEIPIALWIIATDAISPSSTAKVASVFYDGTNTVGQIITNTSNAQVTYDSSGFSFSAETSIYTGEYTGYEINSSNAVFEAYNTYEIIRVWGGSSSAVHTKEVQVGSGATSISFTGIEFDKTELQENMFCFFKSNFGTSSGYSRVIAVNIDTTDMDTYGLEMTNQASYVYDHWTPTFSNGTLTLTSDSASQGGYFHQPGYYTLVYVEKAKVPIIPEGTLSITTNGTYDVTEYASASVSVSGGTVPTPWQDTTGGTSTSTTAAAIGSSFTVQTAGVYRINAFAWRSNTSGTWSLSVYKGSSAVSGGSVTWSGNRGVCSVEVTCAVNDTISIHGSSRGTNYTLTLIGWTAAYKSAS